MSLWQDLKGTLRTFVRMSKKDWDEMDHKLFRIGITAVGFIIAATFWFFFLRHISPFGF